MMVIHKQSIQAYSGVQNLYFSEGSTILKVGKQNGQIAIWFATNNEGTSINKLITILATGEYNYDDNFLDNNEYLDTVVMDDGLVWHVFIERV